ncbi:Fc.00g105950.m01.CDS01 [Cosmosporella sp. VM-42]
MKRLFMLIFGLVQAMLGMAAPNHSLASHSGQENARSPRVERRAGPLRRIQLDTFVRIRDDESLPESDDYFNRDQRPRSYTLGSCAGGEIRVHVSTSLRILSDGSLEVRYFLHLYEGDSEMTTDFDGKESGSFIVPPDQSREHVDSVRNTKENDDDTATVHWWITNERY